MAEMLGRVGRSWPGTWGGPVPTALIPHTPRPRVRAQAVYEGATTTRRARGWHAPTVGPNDSTLGSLRALRDRSRAGVRNDGYARAGIDELVSNIVGTGILPQSKAPDPAFRERLHALWLDWTDEADADGRLDFYGLQALAVRGWLDGGEMFIRLRPRRPEDGLVVPLQLQLLEPELVPHDYNTVAGPNKIRAGIELSPIGRRVAYWAWRQRPGALQDLETTELVRLPADAVVHLYDPLRAGQLRGVPQLTQALLKLHDLDKYDDATLLRQQIANLFAGFIRPPAGAVDADVDPLTGRPLETEGDQGIIGLEPGLMQTLAPGEEIDWSDPPEATGYADFMRAQLMAAAVAAGVPYEILTGDLRGVTDRTVRVILHEFRRRIQQRQHHIVAFMFSRPIWLAFVARAVLAGALEPPAAFFEAPRPWLRVEWIPPAWPYLHPVQDVQHEKLMVRAGFKSRTQVVKERRWDREAVDREIAEENAAADARGLRFESDGRTSVSGAAPAEAPAAASSEGGVA